ncbi:hypothetical protein RchiOBHm_Chr4g0386091 [Rosa chinensis]|uniref:Uncharacterized protein n=1 Tax=Rosa chinensis TaxID=74649 RepID=A0A2P6QP35_ROSCH|nr:hypothetical protein RchiOBHm_Chr4g0386091 [Rosa chinensis]
MADNNRNRRQVVQHNVDTPEVMKSWVDRVAAENDPSEQHVYKVSQAFTDEEYASVRNELMLMNIRAGREDYIMNKPLPIVSVSSDEELRAEFAKRGKTFRVYIDNNRRYQKAEIHHTAKVEFGLDISLDPPN